MDMLAQLEASGYPKEAVFYEVLLFLVLMLAMGRGFYRGLLASLADLAGDVGSAVAGIWLGNTFGPMIYRNTIGYAISEKLSNEVHEYGNAIADVLDGMPYLPQSLHETLEQILNDAGADMVPRLVTAMEPLLLPLVQGVMFLLVYAAMRIILKPLARLLTKVNHLPLVGSLNTLLGALTGIAIGLVDDLILTTVLWVIAGLTDNAFVLLSQTAMQQSYMFRFFAMINPFITL